MKRIVFFVVILSSLLIASINPAHAQMCTGNSLSVALWDYVGKPIDSLEAVLGKPTRASTKKTSQGYYSWVIGKNADKKDVATELNAADCILLVTTKKGIVVDFEYAGDAGGCYPIAQKIFDVQLKEMCKQYKECCW